MRGGGVKGGEGQGRKWEGWIIFGLGVYNRKKGRYKPRGGKAAGLYDGRHPCTRVACERELTLVRMLSFPNGTSLINRQYL
jgi:hypothetical protein